MKFKKIDITLILVCIILLILSRSNNLKFKLASVAADVRFKSISKNMESKKSENITYYYTNKKDETYMNNIKEYIREGEDKTVELFGETPKYPLKIIMFTTSEAFGKAFKVNPKGSMAVTIFNNLYIPCDNINSYVFVHEYTHYKMNSFYKQNEIQKFKIPSWFEEGVAEYLSSTLNSDKFRNGKIEKILDFKKLDKSKEMSALELEGYDTYKQSYLAIKKIVELKGEDSLRKILLKTRMMNFYDSFNKEVGLSIEDFQKLFN